MVLVDVSPFPFGGIFQVPFAGSFEGCISQSPGVMNCGCNNFSGPNILKNIRGRLKHSHVVTVIDLVVLVIARPKNGVI